ncbi:spore coat protein YsxE [Bacillus tianshenii]|nr:spore coat protein YsxE [Bacillus tianshenii]
MKELQSVLGQYKLKPHYIEEQGRLYKLYTWDGVYALKKLGSDAMHANHLSQISLLLQQSNIHHAVPIIPTRHKHYFSYDGTSYYYLMPWVETKEVSARERVVDLFKATASLHQRTTQQQTITQEARKQFYEYSLKEWDERRQKLEKYLEYCERQVYMSPYELNYCLHYTELMKVDEVAKQKLEAWYEQTEEKEKERTCLCHGNLRLEHLVYHRNEKPYLLNFERAYIGPPILDLKFLIEHQFYKMPYGRKSILTAMQTYQRLFPLSEEEKLLLSWELLSMRVIEHDIQLAQAHREQKNELKQVKRLQRAVWLKQNISHFVFDTLEKKPASNEPPKSTSS